MTSGRNPFSRPDGVSGGIDPRHRAPFADASRGPDLRVTVTPGAAVDEAFQPRGETAGGLQLPPEKTRRKWGRGTSGSKGRSEGTGAGRTGAVGELFDDGADDLGDGDYSPWADPRTRMGTGRAARRPPRPDTEPVVPVPRVDMREAMFGRVVPWRFLALGAAVVLALGGIGGFAGGWAGKSFRADHQRVELRQVEGGVADEVGLTAIGEVAQRVQPAVANINVGAEGIAGIGSGVVIDRDGHILTNNHVISLAADDSGIEITVNFDGDPESRAVPAEVVGRDPMTDLAVIKVEDVDGLTVAELGDSDAVQVGDNVVAMGSPQGLNGTVTAGIVSAKNRPIRLAGEGTDTDGVADAIQTDASINPGNSGGPLVDMRGAVIGINTVIYTESGGSQGLGFAIPINMAARIAEQLIAGEQPVHPTIGVTARTSTNGALAGAEVATVVDGGAAADAGIREGDVIVAVGDRSVASADELTVAVWSAGPGEPVPVTIVRNGQRMTLDVTPAG